VGHAHTGILARQPIRAVPVLDLHELPEDGKGFELEDGWLVEVARNARHNWALRTLARIIERAVAGVGSQAVVCDGGEWEISTPAGVRKPDVFIVPREIARATHLGLRSSS
jgi:hypothetical protein